MNMHKISKMLSSNTIMVFSIRMAKKLLQKMWSHYVVSNTQIIGHIPSSIFWCHRPFDYHVFFLLKRFLMVWSLKRIKFIFYNTYMYTCCWEMMGMTLIICFSKGFSNHICLKMINYLFIRQNTFSRNRNNY